MKLLTLLLAGVLAQPLATEPVPTEPPTGGDEYLKYETEDVSRYRDRVTFQLPEPSVLVTEIQPGSVRPMSLQYLFQSGQRYFVERPQALDDLVQRHIAIGKATRSLPGFRVQIYAGTSRQQAFSRKQQLASEFPQVANYMDFRQPNYVVRAGDFLDRESALLFSRELQQVFPGAFIVPADVKVPRLEPEDPELEEEQTTDDWGQD
ncbi:MAG: SPOR domain-containing protein [Bacteroidetes bacterium]|nr:MAG: SPOR domain-containing protein [Bacteroidota bacterium]